MPIPTRSRSLRESSVLQAESYSLKAVRQEDFVLPREHALVTNCRQNNPDKQAQQPGTRDETLKPRQYTTKGPDGPISNTSRIGGVMGPPSQLKRTSSVRDSSQQSVVAPVRTTRPLSVASSANVPRMNGSLPRPRPVSIESSSSLAQKSQPYGQVLVGQSASAQVLTQPRISLHSRNQSTGKPTMPKIYRQWQVGPPNIDLSASPHGRMSQTDLQSSGRGQALSKTPKAVASKPPFSTFQQHFSPKKTSKVPSPSPSGGQSDLPHAASTVSPATNEYSGPGDGTTTVSAEISRLQDELLQLQLMHDLSSSQQKKYLENTRRKFADEFAVLSQDYRELMAQEHAYDTTSNCMALQQWLSEGELPGLEKMQTLARCVQDVTTLTAPNGNFHIVMEEFEAWFERMILISNSRCSGTALLEYHDVLVGPLSQGWHNSVAVLHRKLDHCSQVLSNLGSARNGSGLAIVLDTHKLFVDNLRAELAHSRTIEEIALQQEQIWIDKSIATIMDGDDHTAGDGQRDNPRPEAWKMLT
jgi:hypothetical protein